MDQRHRPVDSDFKQQRMLAWKPMISDRFFYGALLAIGVSFLAVGIPMVVESNAVSELSWDYTDCLDQTLLQPCQTLIGNNNVNYNSSVLQRCKCNVVVSLSGFNGKKVNLFYALTNYYQDHRKYVKSFWGPQLRSVTIGGGEDCNDLRTDPSGRPIAPCGFIANSIFNDTIGLYHYSGSLGAQVMLSGQSISWDSDRTAKFRNPTKANPLCSDPKWGSLAVAKPPNWPVMACELGTTVPGVYSPWSPQFNSSGLGYENEDFIVWMRAAASPSLRKLYRFVSEPLPDGDYAFVIDYNYPVAAFSGTKSIILSTDSWLGGQNPFIGVVYIIVACISFFTAAMFLICSKPRESVKPHW